MDSRMQCYAWEQSLMRAISRSTHLLSLRKSFVLIARLHTSLLVRFVLKLLDQTVLQVVATALVLGWQIFGELLCVGKLHVEQLAAVLRKLYVEVENLLFSGAEQATVPLVKGEIVALKDLHVLFECLRVSFEGFQAELAHTLPDTALVAPTNYRDIISIERGGGLVVRVLVPRSTLRLVRELDLVEKREVSIEFTEAQEGDKFADDVDFEVYLDAERLAQLRLRHHVHLLLQVLVVLLQAHRVWVLVRIVVQVDEAVVQKEARVALLPVRVKDLFATLDILACFNDKACSIIRVGPDRLAGPLMVKHVSIRHEGVRLHTIDLDSENTTTHHHADL